MISVFSGTKATLSAEGEDEKWGIGDLRRDETEWNSCFRD